MSRRRFSTTVPQCLVLAVLASNLLATAQGGVFYGWSPGPAAAAVRSGVLLLSNQKLNATWFVGDGKLAGGKFVAAASGTNIVLPANVFSLVFRDGSTVRASEMKVVDPPSIERLHADAHAWPAVENFDGWAASVSLQDSKQRVAVVWRAVLRDGSNYIREEVAITASGKDQAIAEVRLFDGVLAGAEVVGSVMGSPVTAGNVFVAMEDPLAECAARMRVVCAAKRQLPLRSRQTVEYSLVVGVSPPGQMRRGFLNYLERERAHPYRTFLHYNSWYDIGYGKPYDAAAVQEVIDSLGEALVQKRGVRLDSFLLDDGWDDPQSVWHMNSGFPDGLTLLSKAAEKSGAGIGMWLSPWGGYNESKEKRLDFGRKNGFEMNKDGFALSGPKYYGVFQQVSSDFIKRDGVNQLKIDGTGNVNTVFPGSEFDSDFAAAINLIKSWRALKHDLYVNLTTGTYPSPFWLRYADSIWRGGEDHSFAGAGSWRQRWITYRDAETYRGVVKTGPLYPLNSLMLHGLIFASQAEHLDTDPGNDFEAEIHSYFGSGTQLQELYLSHALISEHNWDLLAEAANWSRRNAEILRDTHWVGGDPGKLAVYGWAAWSPAKAILTLRNPSDRAQSIAIDAGQAFELPAGSERRFVAHSPWNADSSRPSIALEAGAKRLFMLRPFEVLNLEVLPVR